MGSAGIAVYAWSGRKAKQVKTNKQTNTPIQAKQENYPLSNNLCERNMHVHKYLTVTFKPL